LDMQYEDIFDRFSSNFNQIPIKQALTDEFPTGRGKGKESWDEAMAGATRSRCAAAKLRARLTND
jgi:hypothetical protein